MIRKHGDNPVVVLHGGPGAVGSARSLAEELGAVEVLNYAQSIQGQLEEIDEAAQAIKIKGPIIVGHSWGAWLAVIYASEFPVSKVILVGCGAFDEKYLSGMQARRKGKLTRDEENRVDEYFLQLNRGQLREISDFNRLMNKMDAYEPTGHDDLDKFDFQGHGMLMDEFRPLRKSGGLLEMLKKIKCEIVVLHGLNDPHPLEGITEPFDKAGIDYTLHTFAKCGHTPWKEIHAKKEFLKLMRKEIEIV